MRADSVQLGSGGVSFDRASRIRPVRPALASVYAGRTHHSDQLASVYAGRTHHSDQPSSSVLSGWHFLSYRMDVLAMIGSSVVNHDSHDEHAAAEPKPDLHLFDLIYTYLTSLVGGESRRCARSSRAQARHPQ